MADRVFHPYTRWEDWQAGMWQAPANLSEESKHAAHILSDPDTFRDAARLMLADWTQAAEHNLTDMQQNCRSWVGQATCCHLAGIKEFSTRAGWWTLTAAEQLAANEVADQVIAEWRQRQENALFTLFAEDPDA